MNKIVDSCIKVIKSILLGLIKLVLIFILVLLFCYIGIKLYRTNQVYMGSDGSGFLPISQYRVDNLYGSLGLMSLFVGYISGYFLYNSFIYNKCKNKITKFISLFVFTVILLGINVFSGLLMCVGSSLFSTASFDVQILNYIEIIILFIGPILLFIIKSLLLIKDWVFKVIKK